MSQQVIRYRCYWCGRLFVRKASAEWHEQERCPRNPEAQACLTCDHFHAQFVGDDAYEAESRPCCTNHQYPYQHHCDGWDERQPGYTQFVPRHIPVNFVAERSSHEHN